MSLSSVSVVSVKNIKEHLIPSLTKLEQIEESIVEKEKKLNELIKEQEGINNQLLSKLDNVQGIVTKTYEEELKEVQKSNKSLSCAIKEKQFEIDRLKDEKERLERLLKDKEAEIKHYKQEAKRIYDEYVSLTSKSM